MNDMQQVTGKVADMGRQNAIKHTEHHALHYAKRWLDHGGPDALEQAMDWIAWGTNQMLALGWKPPKAA